jgi:hypothetical protein
VLDSPERVASKYGVARDAPFPYGFDPTFLRYRLKSASSGRLSPKAVFVCSMGDMFGDWVPDSWIAQVFGACLDAPWHRYLFLTKNPSRYARLEAAGALPSLPGAWYGSSCHGIGDPIWRPSNAGVNTFASFEPLLSNLDWSGAIRESGVKWAILGALTGSGKGHEPRREWIQEAVEACRGAGVLVFMKKSLDPVWDGPLLRELPWRMGGGAGLGDPAGVEGCRLADELGDPGRDSGGKCAGFQKSRIDDEPCETCKDCRLNAFFE